MWLKASKLRMYYLLLMALEPITGALPYSLEIA